MTLFAMPLRWPPIPGDPVVAMFQNEWGISPEPAASGGGLTFSAVLGFLVLAALVVGPWIMWRRRAGRRLADATETIAQREPTAPPGRYPRPGRARPLSPVDRAARATSLAGLVRRVCVGCKRITATGDGSVILIDWCPSCRSDTEMMLPWGVKHETPVDSDLV